MHPLWWQRRHVSSHANGYKGVEWHPAIDCPQKSWTRSRNSAMVVAGSGERVRSRFIMSHTCSIGDRSGNLVGHGSCCTPRRARCVAAATCGLAVSCWKITLPSCRRKAVARSSPVQCSAHCFLYPAEKPNMTASCNWWPPHAMQPGVEPVGRVRMHSGRLRSPSLRRTPVHPSLAYKQKLLSSLKRTERHFTPQSTLSRHQSSRAWWCRGVSGSLAIGTHDLSLAASRWFTVVLGDTANATCALISSLYAVRAATTASTMHRSWLSSVQRGRPEPNLREWECSTDNSAESSDTPPIHCGQHVQ